MPNALYASFCVHCLQVSGPRNLQRCVYGDSLVKAESCNSHALDVCLSAPCDWPEVKRQCHFFVDSDFFFLTQLLNINILTALQSEDLPLNGFVSLLLHVCLGFVCRAC